MTGYWRHVLRGFGGAVAFKRFLLCAADCRKLTNIIIRKVTRIVTPSGTMCISPRELWVFSGRRMA
jgi:hypothetical protein